MLSQKFLKWNQAKQKVNHCKKIRKGEKENVKEKKKNEKPKDVDVQILISVHA